MGIFGNLFTAATVATPGETSNLGLVVSDARRCVQCGVCGYNCPVGIPVRDYACRGLPVTDAACITCGQCIAVCPRGTLRCGKSVHATHSAGNGPMNRRYIIIGNGAAGVTAAEALRGHDPQGEIIILTAEESPMYSRPGLAYVINGEVPMRQIIARQKTWYEELKLQLVYGRVEKIDTQQRRVLLADGRQLGYHRLLVATGARAVPPPVPGADLQGVIYLDSMAGTKEALRRLRRARRGVVVGGGITALELTEGMLKLNVETHYFVRRDRLWGRVFNDAESKLLEEQMRHHGAHIHYNTEIEEILGDRRGRVRAVRLKDGSEFRCNVVGVAIGVKPVIDPVRDTPVAIDRGILVDETLRSSVPDIFAAGDCAQVYDRWTEAHTLDILWPSAVAEGRTAAANMAGLRQPYSKGTPFNACLLFGLHITTIGQVNPRPKRPRTRRACRRFRADLRRSGTPSRAATAAPGRKTGPTPCAWFSTARSLLAH